MQRTFLVIFQVFHDLQSLWEPCFYELHAWSLSRKSVIQSYLVNSMSSGQDVLFWIISSLNYREVNIKYITPKNDYQFFLSNVSWVHNEKSRGDVSFMHPKHMLIKELLKEIKNMSYSLNPVRPKLIEIRKLQKIKVGISRFYCTSIYNWLSWKIAKSRIKSSRTYVRSFPDPLFI